mmetsp:Transcript_14485/g.22484  ORF Transcript_14485/g.22484 Transcript_14485/m.22484 type:complete len:249 (+) Transcript_14485:298-1044(+)|eukprot:CAMPEP_0184305608 /NCGR_PEP_ID=MMETSP1049-20130417/14843_1 /TAXON_ID=77928 /ORGANISM="Proteomonas sulcata, Strain CCMP704" /LENGTH=248 /DNA_ID=CAMNT_0026617711 /DNA_START=225 /DNA_END=971 /DNA_ORIENTATION=+
MEDHLPVRADLLSRLDADYDGSDSNHDLEDDSDDEFELLPAGRKAPRRTVAAKRKAAESAKRHKGCESRRGERDKEEGNSCMDLSVSESESDAMVPSTRVAPTRNPTQSPSQMKLANLQRHLQQVVEGCKHSDSANADVSFAEETQEETQDPPMQRNMELTLETRETQLDNRKCIIEIRSTDGTRKKFKVFMSDQMEKVMNAFCARLKLQEDSVFFTFDGRRVANEATPRELDMEDDGEVNMVEVHRK